MMCLFLILKRVLVKRKKDLLMIMYLIVIVSKKPHRKSVGYK